MRHSFSQGGNIFRSALHMEGLPKSIGYGLDEFDAECHAEAYWDPVLSRLSTTLIKLDPWAWLWGSKRRLKRRYLCSRFSQCLPVHLT
jgi:hypothetical protein